MLQTLARHPQRIAWFFYALFVSELALPVVTQANEMHYTPYPAWRTTPDIQPPPGFDYAARNKARVLPVKQSLPLRKEVKLRTAQPDSAATGPTQPEMQSFQSVNASNMVDLFSGDFSYNIPLLDVGGYPVNIHYTSGISMDQESSWVGLGWNINPGTISRNMRGLPDDFDGTEKVEKTLSMKANRTIGVTAGGIEMYW